MSMLTLRRRKIQQRMKKEREKLDRPVKRVKVVGEVVRKKK